MTDWIIIILSTVGVATILLAAVGIVRMPDIYLRISVTTKAATMGMGLLLIGAAVYFNELGITSRVIAIIIFLLITAPVGAHMIGRASYFTGIKMWKKSAYDDIKGKYDPKTHELSSDEEVNEKEQ